MNTEQYKQKKRELASQLKDLNELARFERMGIGKETGLILEKERRAIKKQLRKKVSGDE